MHAVEGMPSPADKPALLRFLEMVNYMSKLIPNLADLTQLLRELLHKEVEWHWSDRQEKAFQAIIMISKNPLQFHYSMDLGRVYCKRVDQCVMHPDHLILLKKNCAQIGKEQLAIVYGCNKFHQYV